MWTSCRRTPLLARNWYINRCWRAGRDKESAGRWPSASFPPGEHYVDLRENPLVVELIAPARQYLPLRTFLTAVNSAESSFSSASASTQADSPASVSAGDAYEFASQARLVFV